MSMLSLLTQDRFAQTPAFVNDKRWTQEETRELLERVNASEVHTAPAPMRHQVWAALGKKLSTPRTAKDALNKYHQVCSLLAEAAETGDVLDQAIADNVDDSKPRRLAFASPKPVTSTSTTATATASSTASSAASSSATTTTTSIASTSKLPAATPSSKKKKQASSTKVKVKPTSVRGIKVGDTVIVDSRTWPGVNKPGGAGRVTSFNIDSTFNIKYLLGGSERKVDAEYVHLRNLTAAPVERSRSRRTFYDPINNEAVITDEDGIIKSKKQEELEAREKATKEAAAVKEELARRAAEAAALKASEEQKVRDKIAAGKRKAAAALRKKNAQIKNAQIKHAQQLKATAQQLKNVNRNDSSKKKKRRRSSTTTTANSNQPSRKHKVARSRASSVASSVASRQQDEDAMEEEEYASSSIVMTERERELENYVAPQIDWPLEPMWMDSTDTRPTLLQAAQYVAATGERRGERQGWLTQVMTRM